MRLFLVGLILLLSAGCGPVKKLDLDPNPVARKLKCVTEYHAFTCRNFPYYIPPPEPEPLPEVDCLAEPYRFECRTPSSEFPIPN